MKEVTMKIQSSIFISGIESTCNSVSIYTLDDENMVVSEKELLTEGDEIKKLLADGDIKEHEMINTYIRPCTISSSIGMLKSKLIMAIQNNNCTEGGQIIIEENSDTTIIPLNNKQDCITALQKLKKVIPSTYVDSSPVVQQSNTWAGAAYNAFRENCVPFVLGAVTTAGVALALRNRLE